MKKRLATTTTVADDREHKVLRRTGILYLSHELEYVYRNTKFVVETDDANFLNWHVYFPVDVLHPSLQTQMNEWASKTSLECKLTMEIAFPKDYPKSVPFVRVVRPRFKWQTGQSAAVFASELFTTHGWKDMTPTALFHTICVLFKEGNA
eukprot:7388357-Prymnesium_polylepis.1